jgi:uncharacterized protein YcbK (DUF882 family)
MWMRRGLALLVVLSGLGLIGALSFAVPRLGAGGAAAQAATVPARPKAPPSAAPAAPAPAAVPRETAFTRLPPLRISSANSRESLETRLYDADGRIDEGAAEQLDRLLGDARDKDHFEAATIDRRTLQLLFRAAYHFGAREVEIVSGYRRPGRRREGLHGSGRAVDFKLSGVKATELAAYLRKQPRAGVGIYTHPKTQYVHLDVRDQSFHWLDGSPPRRRWRERSLGPIAPEHDAAYRRENDWPEGTLPPARSATP